uniref:hypothetical protein n=8 Tax=Thiolapillus sp. TaxID=2017437 RepID=UPI003AF5A390
ALISARSFGVVRACGWITMALCFLQVLREPVVQYLAGSEQKIAPFWNIITWYPTANLKLAHCKDRNCGGRTLTVVDGLLADVGKHSSLALDASGNPVISYFDETNRDLKLVHCNDPDCSGSKSVVTIDSTGTVGMFTSLVLDASGDPVISYYDNINHDLKLAHCYDPNCTGGGESIVVVDNNGSVGRYSSLALDAIGQPVISYWDNINKSVKLVHCNDPNCSGGNESIVTVDITQDSFSYISLALDASGNPVISYFGGINGGLKLAHCNDANCIGSRTIIMVDSSSNNASVSSAS